MATRVTYPIVHAQMSDDTDLLILVFLTLTKEYVLLTVYIFETQISNLKIAVK